VKLAKIEKNHSHVCTNLRSNSKIQILNVHADEIYLNMTWKIFFKILFC